MDVASKPFENCTHIGMYIYNMYICTCMYIYIYVCISYIIYVCMA